MAEAPSWCGLVSLEVEEQTHTTWREAWWPVGVCYRGDILDVYVRPLVQCDTSSSPWTTTLDIILPGWLRSASSRRPSSVWTGQHAHLISTRSSMCGTCYRWRFCDVRSNQQLSWNWEMPSLKSGTILRWHLSRDSLEAWDAIVMMWLHHIPRSNARAERQLSRPTCHDNLIGQEIIRYMHPTLQWITGEKQNNMTSDEQASFYYCSTHTGNVSPTEHYQQFAPR